MLWFASLNDRKRALQNTLYSAPFYVWCVNGDLFNGLLHAEVSWVIWVARYHSQSATLCACLNTHTWTFTTNNTITRVRLYSRSNVTKSPASCAGNVSERSLMSQIGRVRETETRSWSFEEIYVCVLQKYVEIVSFFFFPSGPNFTYRPINNYISPSSVGPPGENKEVPQIGIRRNRKPEIYAHFWSWNHLSNWEGN